jgi:RNA polymerase sigma-70 factor, ECF subfamily
MHMTLAEHPGLMPGSLKNDRRPSGPDVKSRLHESPGARDQCKSFNSVMSGQGAGPLQASIDRLEPEKRELVLLVYHHGMTREEIARRLGRPVSTVKTWLRRALNQIKAELGEPQRL